ncbi:MAG TPA: type II toxin-antitoxin system Phd/YefM family antitoxin [Gemmatimonadaceae bacterium]|jgi:prevent-host-death family protein|nr:type II toxin-antitoxin system Phd/YefM family antitoxin [Gemmatimonadaceae bacterium]
MPTRRPRSPATVRSVPAGEFKQHCLQLMDEVRDRRIALVITKHGTPVAQLVPVDENAADGFGFLAGTVTVHGDIVAPDADEWGDDA